MKSYFELPITEAQEQERVVRVSVPAALAGGITAFVGEFTLARKDMLPSVLTNEVLGDVVEFKGEVSENIRTDESGHAKVGDTVLLSHAKEHELETFVMPVNTKDLRQTADQLQAKVTDYLTEHPIKPKSKTRIELEVFDQTFEADAFQQLQFVSKSGTAETLSSNGRIYSGTTFEAYTYGPNISNTSGNSQLLDMGQNLQQAVQSRFTTGVVEDASIAGENMKAVPFTVHQYERLAQLAQNNGYGTNIESFLDEHLYDNSTTAHEQINALLHEENILTDKPSVLVRIVEVFQGEDAVTIDGCQLQTHTIAQQYHHKEYDPTPLSLGLVTVLGVAVAGVRYRQRRRMLDNERLRKLGLDGPAPSKETFEAVKNGTADTRQKLKVLKYQKATELVDDKDGRVNVKRLVVTGASIALAGMVSVFGLSVFGGEKPDEKPEKKPPIHIAVESDKHCSGSNMVAIAESEDPYEENNYFIDPADGNGKKPK